MATATKQSARPKTANEQRLPRLLALVPYLQARPNVAVARAASDFGVTEAQLRRDLTLLWMCGLPGHGPGDLIDLSFEGDTVSVIFDAGMSRPLRLTAEEALALVVALRTLAETPGIADSDAVQRALAKVESVASGEVSDDTVAVALDRTERMLPALAQALEQRRALRMRYYSATRDETTERTIDPVRMFEADHRNYLEAWCRQAEGMRVFRLDRIEHPWVGRQLPDERLVAVPVEEPDLALLAALPRLQFIEPGPAEIRVRPLQDRQPDQVAVRLVELNLLRLQRHR